MTLEERELAELFRGEESDRVEHKSSAVDKNDLRKVICAFANDLAGSGRPGVLFVGRREDGGCAGLDISDELLLDLARMKDDGAITPFPSLEVHRRIVDGCQVPW